MAVRLWDERDRLRPHREPDIARSISQRRCSTSWPGAETRARSSGSRRRRPRCWRLPLALLRRLRALDDGRLTALGERLRALPLHPRLGAVLVAGGGAVEAARRLRAPGRRPARAGGDGRHDDQRRPVGARRVGAAGGAAQSGGRPTRASRVNGPTRIDASAWTTRAASRAAGRLSRSRRQATRGRVGASAAGDGRRRRTGPGQRRSRCASGWSRST